ncbi:hypothetical protein Q2T83_13620 [Fervidibacter sacchari]|uniref:Uncharacterized protein n=1 Tax=Candidatus Fervidibacter sacchari TaxID=1448929 RepID=A0ABT2EQC3_9BACT|nr:hypothetical protein [Candidatus Fervidibacter sacchari]MCS3919646.1 hypothetical protein [Candidatus Fervidibacter sacchari]WKU15363.1 hypothetical protein Q2T83_13620 [Candidatus Fervidibacter sacchari]
MSRLQELATLYPLRRYPLRITSLGADTTELAAKVVEEIARHV